MIFLQEFMGFSFLLLLIFAFCYIITLCANPVETNYSSMPWFHVYCSVSVVEYWMHPLCVCVDQSILTVFVTDMRV